MSEPVFIHEGKTLRSGKFVASAVEERVVTPLEMHEEDVKATAKSVEELQAQVDELLKKH